MQKAEQKVKILFLCTGNSCRSQMAEGWTRHLLNDQIEVWSAGIETHGLNPLAVSVMAEAGVDISHHSSIHVNELMHIPFDYVITVCDHASEHCPIFPGKARVIHRGFDDPPKLAETFVFTSGVNFEYPAGRVLDEATASVDPFTESQIQEAMDLILAARRKAS